MKVQRLRSLTVSSDNFVYFEVQRVVCCRPDLLGMITMGMFPITHIVISVVMIKG